MRIIFLNRENVLQKYVSLRYAMKSRKWKTTSPGAGTPKLAVDIDDMLKRISDMEEKKKDFERFRDEYAGPKLVIRYSGYFRDQASMDRFNRKILELLEVRDLPLKSKHRKILPKRFEDKIENYDEVRHALTSIGREKYLDDR